MTVSACGSSASTVCAMSSLEGRTAGVTGASSGIGAATVVALADRGMHVHALARRAGRVADLASSTGCATLVVDVRDRDLLRGLLTGLEVDVLVNNAGVGRGIHSFADADPSDLDQTIDTNVSAVLHACHAVLPGMVTRGRGHLVLLGSTAGLHALPTTVYGASKGAVHMMTANLRLDLVGTGVRVTEVCPGRVATEFYDAAIDDPEVRTGLKEIGISELGSVDVADAIAYAVEAPWHVNVTTIELQPTEQTYGGTRFDRFEDADRGGS